MKNRMYLVVIHDDVEPEKYPRGPYETEEKRTESAKQLRRELGPECGLFRLDLLNRGMFVPMMDSFSSTEVDDV